MNTVGLGQVTVLGYTLDANIFAALCYLPLFPANIIPCVIALNTKSGNTDFIRFCAVQSLIVNVGFFVLNTVVGGVMGVLGMIPMLGPLLNGVLGLAMFVVIVAYILISLKLVVSAYRGERFGVPFIAPYAEQYSK